MRNTLEEILSTATARGASYADVRVERLRSESVSVRGEEIDRLSQSADHGFAVRVLYDAAWGFAATPGDPTEEKLRDTLDRALTIARASARWKRDGVELAPEEPVEGSYESPFDRHPLDVDLEEKLELLKTINRAMSDLEEIRIAQSNLVAWDTEKVFASSEGSFVEQHLVETGGGFMALARGSGDVQRRSFSDFAQRGYEYLEELELPELARIRAHEATQLLTAETCPVGSRDLVLGADQVALQVHESAGHPIELDRVLGSEATFAGTSFLTLDKRGDFRYGSEVVNITADATIDGALGSFGYDDDGVPAQRTTIVERGIFKDYLTSRETAPMFGQCSNGTNRAVGWSNLPIIRMTNINLEPGDWSLEEIIRDTADGVYMETPKSWSLDDKRLNFHFGAELAYRIEDGSLTSLLKNPAYTGITPEFWGSADAVTESSLWHVHGTPGCAKGEPVQVVHVGHGASPVRFRKVHVGIDG